MSKFTGENDYFTVQVGTYDTEKATYIDSELYKFYVTVEGDHLPVIDTQPESVLKTKNPVLKASLTVGATATGDGTLSYQWYEVGENGAEKLTDSAATTSTYKVALKTLGVRKFYCEVTNTVNGKSYSVNTDTVTVTVYQTYVQSLTITEGENQLFREYGTWPGKDFDVTLDSAKTYTLTVLPLNTTMASGYSMSVSYNGEAAEAGAFQNTLTLDMSKFTGENDYFTVQVGTYDTEKATYIDSELYKFYVTVKPRT